MIVGLFFDSFHLLIQAYCWDPHYWCIDVELGITGRILLIFLYLVIVFQLTTVGFRIGREETITYVAHAPDIDSFGE